LQASAWVMSAPSRRSMSMAFRSETNAELRSRRGRTKGGRDGTRQRASHRPRRMRFGLRGQGDCGVRRERPVHAELPIDVRPRTWMARAPRPNDSLAALRRSRRLRWKVHGDQRPVSRRRLVLQRHVRPIVHTRLLGPGVWQRRLRRPVRYMPVAANLFEWDIVLPAPVFRKTVRKRRLQRELWELHRKLGLRGEPVHRPRGRRSE
jgi:hypothetical protein